MKKTIYTFILLFLLSVLSVSCNNPQKNFNKGAYTQVLINLEEKKVLSKNDHLLKIKSLYNLNRKEESRESTLLYLLMTNEEDERELPVQIFMDLGYSDPLNILILKTTDGSKAQSILFKSYFNTKQYDKAFSILNEYLAPKLSLTQYVEVLIDYPCDNSFTADFFNTWYEIVSYEEIDDFISLFSRFIQSEISDEVAVKCLNLLSTIESDNFFKEKKDNNAKIYELKGDLCYKLHDYFNGNIYYQQSLKLNPNNTTIKNKLK